MSFTHIVKQASRPTCVHCGASCGRRRKTWPAEQQRPGPWDGESWWHPYNPFCTLRCALSFARWAVVRTPKRQYETFREDRTS